MPKEKKAAVSSGLIFAMVGDTRFELVTPSV